MRDKTTIIMTRGDSTDLAIACVVDGAEYTLTSKDRLYFGLMDKHQR